MNVSTPPPNSIDAEQVTIGALLIDAERMMDVAPVLESRDFYDPTCRTIYQALVELYEERAPVDIVTLTEKLRTNKKIQDVGGSTFLASLAANTPTAAHVEKYVEIVRAKSMRRKLAGIGSRITALSLDDNGETTDELLEAAEQQLLTVSRQSTQEMPVDLFELKDQRYDHYMAVNEAEDKTAHYGIRTGFRSLDEVLVGLPPGHLMILAGRPSTGKTALALNIAQNVAYRQNNKVAVFSFEMTKGEVADRVLASLLGVDIARLKGGELTDEQAATMGEQFDTLVERRLFIDDDPDATLANLRSKARRHQLEHGLDLLIVDYLQLIEVTDRAAGENQTQRITYISKNLKALARELGVPIIALSQLSRECEKRNPPVPVLSDLRDSGAIEQDADSVLMLYREGYYNEDCDAPDATDVYVRKNRNGSTDHLELHFNRPHMTFSGA